MCLGSWPVPAPAQVVLYKRFGLSFWAEGWEHLWSCRPGSHPHACLSLSGALSRLGLCFTGKATPDLSLRLPAFSHNHFKGHCVSCCPAPPCFCPMTAPHPCLGHLQSSPAARLLHASPCFLLWLGLTPTGQHLSHLKDLILPESSSCT